MLETRGYDVFAGKEKRKLLLCIEQLGLSAVLSSKAYPLQILEDFQSISDDYYKIHELDWKYSWTIKDVKAAINDGVLTLSFETLISDFWKTPVFISHGVFALVL